HRLISPDLPAWDLAARVKFDARRVSKDPLDSLARLDGLSRVRLKLRCDDRVVARVDTAHHLPDALVGNLREPLASATPEEARLGVGPRVVASEHPRFTLLRDLQPQ